MRANAIVTGIVIKPIEGTFLFPNNWKGKQNKSIVTRFLQMDPKGNIPVWIVNASKKRSAEGQMTLKKAIESQLALEAIEVKENKEPNSVPTKQVRFSMENPTPKEEPKETEVINPKKVAGIEQPVIPPELEEVRAILEVKQKLTEKVQQMESKIEEEIREIRTKEIAVVPTVAVEPEIRKPSSEMNELLNGLQKSLRDLQQSVHKNEEKISRLEGLINSPTSISLGPKNYPSPAPASWSVISVGLLVSLFIFAATDIVRNVTPKRSK